MLIIDDNKLAIILEVENPSLCLANLQDALETTINVYEHLTRIHPNLEMMKAQNQLIDLRCNIRRVNNLKKIEIISN